MNATSLYVSTCRLILQAKVDEPSTWQDLYKVFPCLRQSLSCTVCGNLLIEPYTPTETNCQHHVCRTCKGGRKKLKPSCSWCKDYSLYVENVQLRTLLQCYKKLCQYVTSSEIYRTLSTLPSSSNNNTSVDNSQALLQIIREGAGFKDDFRSSSDLFMLPLNPNPASYTSTSTQTVDMSPGLSEPKDTIKSNSNLQNGGSPVYSVYAASGNRLTLKRTDTEEANAINGESSDTGPFRTTRTNKVRKRASIVPGIVTRCKCQLATAKSSCRVYRCPCYSANRACTDCACRSCNNPLGVNKLTEGNGDASDTQPNLNSVTS